MSIHEFHVGLQENLQRSCCAFKACEQALAKVLPAEFVKAEMVDILRACFGVDSL